MCIVYCLVICYQLHNSVISNTLYKLNVQHRLVSDACLIIVQVERIVDSALGMQWPQEEYAERGWKMMMGFNMWFHVDTLLSSDEQQDLKEEFLACADTLGKNIADGNGLVDDARSFIFAVGKT